MSFDTTKAEVSKASNSDHADNNLNDSSSKNEENDEKEEKEAMEQVDPTEVEEKDPYRRGIHRKEPGLTGLAYSHLDSGSKEKKGKKYEVKILQTKNKLRIKKELLVIRRFLGMSIDKIKVQDERTGKMKYDKFD
mmetsp:Transcript_42683/g.65484  ORF Transcript_42683/g.65484 Transcript_42683/m.65484 type:complete len:135 (-) Transcript_42683:3-407(-)